MSQTTPPSAARFQRLKSADCCVFPVQARKCSHCGERFALTPRRRRNSGRRLGGYRFPQAKRVPEGVPK